MGCGCFRVRGLVQGVGFRPYVWRLAHELQLSGWVRNDGFGVLVTVDGEKVPEFIARLPHECPPLARIDRIEEVPLDALTLSAESGFFILDSLDGEVKTAIGPDAALCPDCLADICDPTSRRWRYAFTSCTHCGPRYTVTRRLPYDRAQTSLVDFPLCTPCTVEYTDPSDRRFHAETSCCVDCGPRLALCDAHGNRISGDPLVETLSRLRAGEIVAIKGLGGFHLVCDARQSATVATLRQRKHREAKPFALMGLNVASLASVAQISDQAEALLTGVSAPIVLCPKGEIDLPAVAPDLAWLGVMLPATPLHVLLWHEAAGRPVGTDWTKQVSDLLLVMTSANPNGEPLVIGNDEALQRLSGIADAFLMHDRDIVVRCDDSVLRDSPSGPAYIRRARGAVPLPIPLANSGPTVLALGGYLKNTVCVLRGREAFLSQHVGSLDNAAAIGFLEETVAHLTGILDVRPEVIAHDLHPDFPSTHLALRLAAEQGLPAIAVGHHEAHLAALCAEHGLDGDLLGLALDGVGLGPDGTAWGGEMLYLPAPQFGQACRRLGHLCPLRLPGGDRAAREPWRLAVSALFDAGLQEQIAPWLEQTWPDRSAKPLCDLLARDFRCPPTSSLGRLFDVAAALLGVCAETAYEGQAGMVLEGLAERHGPLAPLAGGFVLHARAESLPQVLDFSPLWPALLVLGKQPAAGASLFHATVAAGLAAWVKAVLLSTVDLAHTDKIGVAGGCAMNGVLMSALRSECATLGLRVLEARLAPPNDGGLALGQAWIARQTRIA